jgi:hypothetical protein
MSYHIERLSYHAHIRAHIQAEKLPGIKGYYINLPEAVADNQTIINRYHELYKVEQAFRVSKSDLPTKPVFHYKEVQDAIKLHILVYLMALVIAKHIALKTGDSIRKVVTECKKVATGRMLNHITNKEVQLTAHITPKADEYLAKLTAPH